MSCAVFGVDCFGCGRKIMGYNKELGCAYCFGCCPRYSPESFVEERKVVGRKKKME